MRRFVTTSKSKSPLIESLALAIERGFLALLDHPILLAELASYRLERLPGRRLSLWRASRYAR